MHSETMLTKIDSSLLAQAFPAEYHNPATRAGDAVWRHLTSAQWTERLEFQVQGQAVLIPARLRFASPNPGLDPNDDAWPFAAALRTCSLDGFERQWAARQLLGEIQPWFAPFVVKLLGEYVIEILDDIAAALTPENIKVLAHFIAQNQECWATTKRRIASYWNAYYRARRSGQPSTFRRAYLRPDYVGFRISDALEASARGVS